MAYVRKQIANISVPTPAFRVLMDAKNINMQKAQRLIDRARLYANEELVCKKGTKISGLISLIEYEPISRGLEPIFEHEDFVIYDKPSGVLTHPNGRGCEYSLCDEIWAKYGPLSVVAHRLDRQTSGLLLVARNEAAAKIFKEKFAKREVQKSYLAYVKGKFAKFIEVNEPISPDNRLKIKMKVSKNGKFSKSTFKLIKYYEKGDFSLIRCFPKTGRQHQLRVHLAHINHAILGDMLYGVDIKEAKKYLDKALENACIEELCGAKRLCLHADFLQFYYKNKKFGVKSLLRKEFMKTLKDKI